MFGRLHKLAERRVEERRKRLVARLATATPPPGIEVSANDEGITLTGWKLRRRFIEDVRIRGWFR